MVLVAIIGNLGAGKTLFLTREGYHFLNKDYNVYTNYHVAYPHVQLKEPKQLIYLGINDPDTPKVALLDEGYLWFDSYIQNRKILQFYRNLINVTRKLNYIVYFTTQSLSQINFKTRMIFDYVIESNVLPKHKLTVQKIGKKKYAICKRYLDSDNYNRYYYKPYDKIPHNKFTSKKKAQTYLFLNFRHDLKVMIYAPNSFGGFSLGKNYTIHNIQKYASLYDTNEIINDFITNFEMYDNKKLNPNQQQLAV